MLLVVDNSSSYFNDLVRCLGKISANYEIKRHDELDSCKAGNYDGIILSGRTNNLKSMNVANMHLVNLAYEMINRCWASAMVRRSWHLHSMVHWGD